MIRFAFKKGLRFLEDHGRRAWTIVKRLATGKIQLEDDNGEIQALEVGEIHTKWASDQFIIDYKSIRDNSNIFYLATPRDLSTYDERNQGIARRRHGYLTRLASRVGKFVFTPEKLKPILEEIAAELGDKKPPPVSTVYRWWARFRATKCVTTLVDGRQRAGRKKNAVAYGIFEDALYSVYLNPQKEQGKAVFEEMQRTVARMNSDLPSERRVKMPGRATVYRWIKALHQHLVSLARLGKDATDKEFRAALKKLKVTNILERVEVDHTPLDLLVIDKATQLPLGRPWLTLVIDRYSRMILGFYVSFHAPSSYSLLQCLKRAIMPKEEWLSKFPDIKGSWPARGIPVMIVCDNGMDLHSNAFEDICAEMGVQILYTPAGHPYLKGAIERMFRTMNQGLIHRLPGTVFSNVDARGDYPSEEVAAIDLETLTHLLTKWIVEVYHRERHRGLGMSPLQAWSEQELNTIIELPASPQHLDVLVGIPAERTLFHYGIELDCIRYNCDELQLIRARLGGWPELQLKYYEQDVGYIHVFDESTSEYIRVPAVDSEYASGLSRYMHGLIREYAKRKYGREVTDVQVLESKAAIQGIVAEAIQDKKMARRKKGAVAMGHDSDGVLENQDNLVLAQQPVSSSDAIPEPLDPGLDDELPDYGVSKRTGTRG